MSYVYLNYKPTAPGYNPCFNCRPGCPEVCEACPDDPGREQEGVDDERPAPEKKAHSGANLNKGVHYAVSRY